MRRIAAAIPRMSVSQQPDVMGNVLTAPFVPYMTTINATTIVTPAETADITYPTSASRSPMSRLASATVARTRKNMLSPQSANDAMANTTKKTMYPDPAAPVRAAAEFSRGSSFVNTIHPMPGSEYAAPTLNPKSVLMLSDIHGIKVTNAMKMQSTAI